jgi:hypothetical protein
MGKQKLTGVVAVVLLVAMSGAANAWFSGPKLMYITFSGPVALPGVTLPGGTYIFETVDTSNSNNLVRVRARDYSKVYLQRFTLQIERPAGMPRDRAIVLGESREGIAPRVEAWFPQGEPLGHKFIY